MPKRRYPLPEIEYLRSRIDYNPMTGILTWKNGKLKGKRAFNSLQTEGYLQGAFEYQKFLAHHVAWAIYYGEWPKSIDHENHDREDNSILNLRLATAHENGQNLSKSWRGTEQIGVTWNKRDRVWQAHITYKTRLMNLGQFKEYEDAVKRVKAAHFLYGFHANHGT
jgi:hypothetical protein